ncbi:MAG TPA: hypothetical protein VEZ11_18430 [Thermoanaerobaculia bacterium]|nr:hypothetical protein [Thermoanaerobaculia bacterium]
MESDTPVESDSPEPAPPEDIESATPVPVQDDDALSLELIEKITAGPAPLKFMAPVTQVPPRGHEGPPSAKGIEIVTPNQRPTVSPQVKEPIVKSSADHRTDQKKVAGLSHPSVVPPSAVRKIDGQYAVWILGSAQGVKVGDEVSLVRGGEKIGRGQVIAVRADDCDLEIAETYAVASVAVGDGVKLLKRAITP